MNWIVITSPSFFDGEVFEIKRLLDAGVDTIHLRKPNSDIDFCRKLLDDLSSEYLERIVLHDHFSLCADYGLKGIHLNSRCSSIPEGHIGSISRSCHTLDEVMTFTYMHDYIFLSPIFDSISKEGYKAAFSLSQLQEASLSGIINNKVMALGGITASSVPIVGQLGFGGVVCLGDIWTRLHSPFYSQYLSDMERAIHSSQ